MPYGGGLLGGIDPRAMAFGGALLAGGGQQGIGFGPAFGHAMHAYGQAAQARAAQAAQQQEQLLQLYKLRLLMDERAQEQAALAKTRSQELAAAGQREELRGQIPAELQELYDVDPDTAIKLAYPAGLSADQRSEEQLARERLQLDRERFSAEQAKGDPLDTKVARILAANPELAQAGDAGVQRAVNVALGLVQSATDPIRGGTATYNLATSQGAPVELPKPEAKSLGAKGQPITIQALAGEIGAVPWAEDVLARTVGQAAPGVVDKARTEAATQLQFVKRLAVSALSTTSRPSIWEQQQIDQLFPAKGIYDSEQRALYQMGHLRNMLAQTHDTYAGWINARQLPVEQENELRLKMAELRSLHGMLPVGGAEPEVEAGQDQQPQAKAAASAPARSAISADQRAKASARGSQLEQQVRAQNPGAPDQLIQRMVIEQLRREGF